MAEASCGSSPAWQSDSRYLEFSRGMSALKVSLDSGEITSGREDLLGYHASVPEFLAYSKDGNIVVENASGVVVHRVPYVGWENIGFSTQALSYDGRYVGVNFRNTDPDRVETVARVIDMITGKEINCRCRPATPWSPSSSYRMAVWSCRPPRPTVHDWSGSTETTP
jgi:hypothetical protein